MPRKTRWERTRWFPYIHVRWTTQSQMRGQFFSMDPDWNNWKKIWPLIRVHTKCVFGCPLEHRLHGGDGGTDRAAQVPAGVLQPDQQQSREKVPSANKSALDQRDFEAELTQSTTVSLLKVRIRVVISMFWNSNWNFPPISLSVVAKSKLSNSKIIKFIGAQGIY